VTDHVNVAVSGGGDITTVASPIRQPPNTRIGRVLMSRRDAVDTSNGGFFIRPRRWMPLERYFQLSGGRE